MTLKRVLVVYKKSSYQVYAHERKDKHFIRAFRSKHETTERFLATHESHSVCLAEVKRALKTLNIEAKYVFRARPFNPKPYDLIITVGGDGTFLEASHNVKSTPMLGVNSSPKDSVGVFCGVVADTFEWTIHMIQSGRLKPTELTRLQVRLNGAPFSSPVLNDVLVTHSNPAATCRYILRLSGMKEEQKSSGIWVATPAGSTAAIGTAGGRFMSAKADGFQFLVRELYMPPGTNFKLESGIIDDGSKMVIYSKMRTGKIFLDGPHRSKDFPIGSKLEISAKAPKLKVFKFNEARRRMFL